MGYTIFTNRAQFDSTDYIEIGPGKYSDKHWQEGFIFISDESFEIAVPLIRKHFPNYDHYDMNDIPLSVGKLIAKDFKEVSSLIGQSRIDEAIALLGLGERSIEYYREEIKNHSEKIGSFFGKLAQHIEEFYEKGEWICVWGL